MFGFLRDALYKKELTETKQLVEELSYVLEYYKGNLDREDFSVGQCRRVHKLCSKLATRSSVLGWMGKND